MAWPTTGSGSVATGHVAVGTATTILWGTKDFSTITGWLTVLRVSEKTMVAYEEQLPNGDGLTAGLVQGIDGVEWDVEVRDDTTQVPTDLQVGKKLYLRDGGGLVPGNSNRNNIYLCIITANGWDTAPKTAAGRTLTLKKFSLIN